MQAIERIRAALKHLKDVPGSLKTGLGIDEYRAACRPVAMSEVLSHITALEAENERLKDLADSEGSRAVEYLRRARNVEAEVERLRKDAERKPMTDEDTLALFNRIQLRMRFTDADARPFASGVASAEFFHGIK